jgi:hypothetical protein
VVGSRGGGFGSLSLFIVGVAAYLGHVRPAARHAPELANQLLAFSRQQVLRPRAVSLTTS